MGSETKTSKNKSAKGVKTRVILIIAIVLVVVFFALGILIGHFAIEKKCKTDRADGGSLTGECKQNQFTETHKAYMEQYLEKAIANSCYEEGTCNTFGLPLTYIAYHLNGKTINMDGRLDDEAWAEVPWTETFVDMRGADFPKPYFETKLKVRWDDERLYIGAYMQETDFWGTLIEDESKIWWENAFIAYIIPDNSMHNYKEMQINVLNATWDLLVKKPFIDTDCHIRTGNNCPDVEADDSSWFSGQVKKVYTDGGINDPNEKGTFWSIEWSFTFEALSNHTDRLQPRPNVGETWFADFLRAQYHVKVENGSYVQDSDKGFDAWAWQPTYNVDPHFPETFGLVQFKKSLEDKQFLFERWHLYKALFAVFNAQKRNRILKRRYNMDLYKTEVAPFVLSNMCADVRMVSASDDAFEATAKSRIDASLPIAHIRQDRYVWFTDN